MYIDALEKRYSIKEKQNGWGDDDKCCGVVCERDNNSNNGDVSSTSEVPKWLTFSPFSTPYAVMRRVYNEVVPTQTVPSPENNRVSASTSVTEDGHEVKIVQRDCRSCINKFNQTLHRLTSKY